MWYNYMDNFEWGMNDIMKIVKSLEESGLFIKGVGKTIKNEANNKKANLSVCC